MSMDGSSYPMIESAAADSSSGHTHQDQTTPTSSSPSSSSDDQQLSDVPQTKRQRMTSDLDDSAGFMFPEPGRRASGPSSIMHPSGRILPVGIAQPMQSRGQEQQRDDNIMMDSNEKTDSGVFWKEEDDDSGSLETKPEQQKLSVTVDAEEDELAVQEMIDQINTDLSSSDSDSDSSSNDEDQTGMESGQNTTNIRHKTLGEASLAPPPTQPTLPINKRHHVFVSHSTGDQLAVKVGVVVPLRDIHKMQVVACYHCMENKQYNDKHIGRAMTESCVVVLAISPSYLDSQRCQREWRYACELAASERGCQVIVAALGKCSRPENLKSFLYLDFIDKDKRDAVLNKMVGTINCVVRDMSRESDQSSTRAGGDVLLSQSDCDAIIDSNDRDTPFLLASAGDNSDPNHQRRMEVEFEADFGMEYGGMEYEGMESKQKIHQQDSASDGGITTEETDSTLGGMEAETVPCPHQERLAEEDELKKTSRKRKRESEEVEEGEVSDSSSEEKSKTSSDPKPSQEVAKFYDGLAQPDADKREESPIFYMRNFNNWVKSVLLRTYLQQPGYTVLDLCCGKGGDLLKWKEGGIGYVICADISASSVEACEGRYNSHRMIGRGARQPPFEAEFHVADCCAVRLRDCYHNSGCSFNVVSCQFSVHYSFETYNRARMMLRNACENLRPGGYFIGTTIDSNEIVRRLRSASQQNEDGSYYIGNDVFSVTLDPSVNLWETLPLFSAKYNFKLHGVVDLPEYLVHFPLFEEMLKDFGMELILCQNFVNFFNEHRHSPENANLMFKMQAFSRDTGTMPPALWEVIGLYLVYVFRKKDPRHEYH